MSEKKYNDITPKDKTPTFEEMVFIIEKNFKDYLEQSKAFTPEEIEEGWQRYKTLNHLYQDSIQPGGAVWVKASTRLPGWKLKVKWRDGDNHSHATDGKISFFEMDKPNLEGWEWLDESTAEQPAKPTFWDVAKAFKWAAEYGDEKGEQLILSEDGQWMLLSEEGGVTETDELTPGNVAELYCLQCGFDKDEQPGREVINIEELKLEIRRFEESVTKPIASGTLRDGRNFQVQVIITTNEDDFIEPDEYVEVKD